MNKKTIITALLALVSLGASAQLESVKELSMKSEYFNHESIRLRAISSMTRPTMMSSTYSTHKTARCLTSFTVCSILPASPTLTAVGA